MIRKSNFELLRLVSMFCIILGHLLFFIVEPHHNNQPMWGIMQMPLHIGVILFVLISGYFGIKASVKGLVHLLAIVFLVHVPFSLVRQLLDIQNAEGIIGGAKSLIYSLMAISKSPYWFVRTYLWLFLLSPMINSFVQASRKHLHYLLLVCFFMALYMGLVSGTDGKGVVNFIFIYIFGRYLRQTEPRWNIKSKQFYFIVWICLNISVCTCAYLTRGTKLYEIIHHLFYPYSSIGLFINSVILFVFFAKLDFVSRWINTMAGSVFAMYLIHCQEFILYEVLTPVVIRIDDNCAIPGLFLLYLIFFTILIMFVIHVIYQLAQPAIIKIERGATTFLQEQITKIL